MIGPFNKSKDKLSAELDQLEKTKAELERQARELETVLNIPPVPEDKEEEPTRGARFLDIDPMENREISPAAESARLKVEQRRAKRRFISLAVIVGILLLILVRMIS